MCNISTTEIGYELIVNVKSRPSLIKHVIKAPPKKFWIQKTINILKHEIRKEKTIIWSCLIANGCSSYLLYSRLDSFLLKIQGSRFSANLHEWISQVLFSSYIFQWNRLFQKFLDRFVYNMDVPSLSIIHIICCSSNSGVWIAM